MKKDLFIMLESFITDSSFSNIMNSIGCIGNLEIDVIDNDICLYEDQDLYDILEEHNIRLTKIKTDFYFSKIYDDIKILCIPSKDISNRFGLDIPETILLLNQVNFIGPDKNTNFIDEYLEETSTLY